MLKKLIQIIPIGLSMFVVALILSYAVFVEPEALPDLEVKNLQYHGRFDPPRAGDEIGYKFDIVNTGKVSVNGTFRAEFYREETLLSSPTYIEYHLLPGESITSSHSTSANFIKSGVINFSIVIDSASEIEESNEDNNIAYATIEVLPKKETGLPDLQVKNLKYYSPAYVGDTVYYKFDIFNNGDVDFNGDISVGYTHTKKTMQNQKEITDLSIAVGESESIEIISEKKFSETGNTELSVMIDFWNRIRELDEFNNREFIIVDVLPKIIKKDDNNISDIDTSDWEVYTNEEFGFELKYPEHWVIGSPAYIGNASRSGNTYHILGMTPYGFEGDWSVLISVTPHPIDEILEDDNYYWNKGWDIENKENILINNISAQKVTWSNSAIMVYFEKPDASLTVEFGGYNKERLEPSGILSAFKFINP